MKIKVIISFFVLVSLSSCTLHWGNFKRIANQAPAGKSDAGPRVSGEDCRFLANVLYRWPSIERAAQDALRKSPGSTGLKDVKIDLYQQMFYDYKCFKVSGVPMK